MEVHGFTKEWHEGLPAAYRAADAVTDQGIGGYPMRRWMNGIGEIAGQVRDIADAAFEGSLTDPARVPDQAVRWLAQMLGIPNEQRNLSPADLRVYLTTMTSNGRPAVGTRQSIAEVAQLYLKGTRQVSVVPHKTKPHVIVILVKADEVQGGSVYPDPEYPGLYQTVINGTVKTDLTHKQFYRNTDTELVYEDPENDNFYLITPNGGLLLIERQVRAAGVVPAGHLIEARDAVATWEAFEAEVVTWADLEEKGKTWAEHDSIGVDLVTDPPA